MVKVARSNFNVAAERWESGYRSQATAPGVFNQYQWKSPQAARGRLQLLNAISRKLHYRAGLPALDPTTTRTLPRFGICFAMDSCGLASNAPLSFIAGCSVSRNVGSRLLLTIRRMLASGDGVSLGALQPRMIAHCAP